MRMETLTIAAAFAILALAGCKDVGLEGLNTPLEEATHAPPQQPSVVMMEGGTAAAEHVGPVRVGNQRWIPGGPPIEMEEAAVQSVGSAAGRIFYAFTWDEPPYDRLLVPARDGEWQEYMEVYAGLAERGEVGEAGAAGQMGEADGAGETGAAGETDETGAADPSAAEEEESI